MLYLDINNVRLLVSDLNKLPIGTLVFVKSLINISEIIDIVKNTINTPYKSIIAETHSSGLIGITQDKSGFTTETHIEINISNILWHLSISTTCDLCPLDIDFSY